MLLSGLPLGLFCLQAVQQLQNGIPCLFLDLLLALLPDFWPQELLLQAGSGGLHGLEELVQHSVQTVGGIFPRGFGSLTLRGQHPLLRVLDHPHIFLPSFDTHHIRHDLHRHIFSQYQQLTFLYF